MGNAVKFILGQLDKGIHLIKRVRPDFSDVVGVAPARRSSVAHKSCSGDAEALVAEPQVALVALAYALQQFIGGHAGCHSSVPRCLPGRRSDREAGDALEFTEVVS
jgi:hypothetical protein